VSELVEEGRFAGLPGGMDEEIQFSFDETQDIPIKMPKRVHHIVVGRVTKSSGIEESFHFTNIRVLLLSNWCIRGFAAKDFLRDTSFLKFREAKFQKRCVSQNNVGLCKKVFGACGGKIFFGWRHLFPGFSKQNQEKDVSIQI
jgi:hypothetical protein